MKDISLEDIKNIFEELEKLDKERQEKQIESFKKDNEKIEKLLSLPEEKTENLRVFRFGMDMSFNMYRQLIKNIEQHAKDNNITIGDNNTK